LHDKISNKTGVNAMNKYKRLELLLEKKASLLYLINRHAQNKDRIWEGDETGYEDYINAALDEINAINKEIKELSPDDDSAN
jgi:hypothetical protein